MPSSSLSNEWHDGSELPGNMLKWIKVVQKIISSRGLGEILGVNLIQKVRNGIFCGNLLRLFRSGEIISSRGLSDILGVDLIQKVSNGIFLRKWHYNTIYLFDPKDERNFLLASSWMMNRYSGLMSSKLRMFRFAWVVQILAQELTINVIFHFYISISSTLYRRSILYHSNKGRTARRSSWEW